MKKIQPIQPISSFYNMSNPYYQMYQNVYKKCNKKEDYEGPSFEELLRQMTNKEKDN